MKRKLVAFLSIYAMIGGQLFGAANVVYYATPISESALAFSKTYTFDLNSLGVNTISVETVFSSAAPAAATWTDGVVSTASVSVASFTALAESRSAGTLTVTSNTALTGSYATDTISVASNAAVASLGTSAILSLNGSSFTATIQFQVGTTSTATAINIARAISGGAYGVTASTTGTGSTVTLTMSQYGTFYNSYTLTSSSAAALTVGSSFFKGGTDPADLRINNILLRNGANWNTGNTSTDTASSIVTAIRAQSALSSILISSWTTGGVINLTAISTGSAYVYALYSSTQAALQIAGPVTTSSGTATGSVWGGTDAAVFKIKGVAFRAGYDFQAVTNASTTAKNLSAAIMANASVSAVLVTTWTAAGVVTATASLAGSYYNFQLFSSTQAALTLNIPVTQNGGTAAGLMQGGTDSAITTASSQVTIANALTLALPVLYTKTAGTSPGALVAGTTYFAIPVDSTHFKLSDTSTGAIAGIMVSIATQTATGGGSFTVTPLAFTGSSAFKWQVSNDGTNYQDMIVSSGTVFSSSASSFTYTDMGEVRARYLRLNFTKSTTGGTALTVITNGKN